MDVYGDGERMTGVRGKGGDRANPKYDDEAA